MCTCFYFSDNDLFDEICEQGYFEIVKWFLPLKRKKNH